MRLPSWPSLIAAAGGASIGLGLMMALVNKQRDNQANQATFVNRAITIMREQETIKELLGDDIQVGRITLNDGWGRVQRLEAQLRVPLKGERDIAFLYAYARRKDEKDLLKLYKLEATFSKIAGKKLVLMDRTNQEDDDDGSQEKNVTRTSAPESPKTDNGDKSNRTGRKKTKEEIREEMKSWNWR